MRGLMRLSSVPVLVAALVLAGCGGDPSTPPTAPATPTAAISTSAATSVVAAIASVSPSSITASANPQTITVTGSNFQSGLTLAVNYTGVPTTTISGAQITNVTATSFQVGVTFTLAGDYSFQVRMPGVLTGSNSFNVTVQAPPYPVGPSIAFVASDPVPGSQLVATDTNLTMTFSVGFPGAIPKAMLKVELLDGSGLVCGFGYTKAQDATAGSSVTLTTGGTLLDDGADTPCPRPTVITSVRVTLTGAGPTTYQVQSFPISYPLSEYPASPPGLTTPPVISSFSWANGTTGCGSCAPLPLDPVNVTCTVKAADGAAATVTITFTWDGASPTSSSQSLPTGATAASRGASVTFGSTAVGQPPRATAVCSVVNTRGETATSTIRIPS